MSLLRFGTGWRDSYGRERSLVWSSDLCAVLFVYVNGDIQVVRRGVADELGVRTRLMGWEDHVDDPTGPEWVTKRVGYWVPGVPDRDCILCQGEGYHAGPEGVAVSCLCGEDALRW